MEDLVKPPKTRRAHLKVKTGCLTCKLRRIKCDEERPSCRRCLKFEVTCDGYNHIPGTASSIRQIRHHLAVLKPRLRPISLAINPSCSNLKTEEEYRYFDVFTTSTAYEIFPTVEMGRLRLMFLQASETDAAIRHAIIALGALDKTAQSSRYVDLNPNEIDPVGARRHYQSALREYAKALRFAQRTRNYDLRTALMTSLAILSFEGWYGSHDLALEQIKIGMRLLEAWTAQNRHNKSASVTPTPHDVGDVLSPIFGRLSIQLASAAADQSPASSLLSKSCVIDAVKVERIPEVFQTLEEASDQHTAIMNQLVNFVSKGHPPITRAGKPTRTYPVYVYSAPIPPSVLQEKERLIVNAQQWIAAFDPLKTRLEYKGYFKRKVLLTLELRVKAAWMSLVAAFAENESVYDEYYYQYQDMVDLTQELLNLSPSGSAANVPKFCFDLGVIIHLWGLGLKCRDPVLRRRIISLLIEYPRREALWDSVFSGKIIEAVMNCEEEFMVDGYVPEWARIRCAIFDVDTEHHKVEVEFQQRISALSEETATRRKTAVCYTQSEGETRLPYCGGVSPIENFRTS